VKSREELLQSIASARTLAQSYLAGSDTFLLTRIPRVVVMLDMMEARVLAVPEMLEPDAFDDIPLGRYAAREFEQPNEESLVKALCHIQYALKRR
jgi:hypothetical protein